MASCIIAYTTKALCSYLADNHVNAHDIRKIDFVCVKKMFKNPVKNLAGLFMQCANFIIVSTHLHLKLNNHTAWVSRSSQ